jgi:signal transduction histidine kinase
MFKLLKRSYYKLQIILLFSLVAIAIVIVASRISYIFTRDLYLEQINEQVKLVAGLLGNQFDDSYLQILSFGTPVKPVRDDFIKIVAENDIENFVQEAFIFNDNYIVFVHSDSTVPTMHIEQRLFINRNELSFLKIHESLTSLPFKGDDGNWYMWGFYNFNDHFYLAIRENATRLQRVEEFSLIFWFIGLGGVLITVLLSWSVAAKITRPINKLVTFSLEIGKGKLNIEVPPGIKGELKLLADAMNVMKTGLAKNQQEKEKMLAQIAHEIRNPLGSIEILAGLVKEDLLKNKQDFEFIEKILGEVKELKDTITSYLNLSRPVEPVPEWCYLNEIYDDLFRIFKKKIEIKNCRIELEYQLNKIWFDRCHLKIILINLLSNSIDAIEKNGLIQITSSVKNNSVQISVEDNGKGMDDEIKSSIFNPFFTTKPGGTGLGLATCRKLSLENNSELFLEFSNGRGTKFTLLKTVSSNE